MAKSVPNTISDKDMASLRRRAEKVSPPMFSTEAVRRRLASGKQHDKANQS
jgi:hypothetical protein